MPVSSARAAAFDILLRVEGTDAYASELLHSPQLGRLSPRDHHLCTELVMGVLRWRSALDRLIRTDAGQAFAKLDIEVATALRLGVYQLLSLDRIPRRAAIHESVELVKRARKRSAAGMVNAILRKVNPAGFTLDNDPAHPAWLIDRWRSSFSASLTKQIRDYNQRPPITALRPLTTDVVAELRRDGIQLGSGRLLNSALVVDSGPITRARAFREGRVAIQDEASQLVALLVGRGKAILDCCAAPGGKTRILAEQNPTSTIIAMELHPARARLMKRLVSGSRVRFIAADARAMPFRNRFDRILVDAPCSGTGTLARNPEIKWRLKREDLLRLQSDQLAIASAALAQLAWRGRMIYSTCSLEPEENEQVVDKILAAESRFHLISCAQELENLRSRGELAWQDIDSLTRGPYLRTLPGIHPCDGFFAAIFERG